MSLEDGVKTVKLTINEIELEVPQGELIVESVKRLGLEIPVFCYHPRMKPVGMCRMCLVEVGFRQADGSVRMMPKPQAGCTLPASDNMVILTDSESVHRDRRGVLEFLLVNHPLDCPICDRGGECPLQNNTLAYGPSTSRFIELKRHLPKAFPLSKYVTLDLERCIQCGRCVRFTEEISGEAELAFRFRGADMQPSTFKLMDFESKFSGNVIEVCPVGALTSAEYRFRARPWDLQTTESVCTRCSNGCNVWFDHRAGKYVRTNGRTNEAVNEEWTCDKGKFGHGFYNSAKRLKSPMVRRGDKFEECSWSEAYDEIARGFDRPSVEIAGIASGQVSNEGLYLFRKLLRDELGAGQVGYGADTPTTPSVIESTIADIETAKTVIVFGTKLADELPIVFLRLRKAATLNGTKVIVVGAEKDETSEFAAETIIVPEGSRNQVIDNIGQWLEPGAIVITSDLVPARENLKLRELCTKKGARFNCWATQVNGVGAQLLGFDSAPSEIIETTAGGTVKALWLVEADSVGFAAVQKALEQSEFVVYQGIVETDSMAYASVVLPMAAPAEEDGTWTNCEGRVQLIKQAIGAPGQAKPAWRIFSETMLRLKPSTPFFNPGEVFDDMAKNVQAFEGCRHQTLPAEGQIVVNRNVAVVAGDPS